MNKQTVWLKKTNTQSKIFICTKNKKAHVITSIYLWFTAAGIFHVAKTCFKLIRFRKNFKWNFENYFHVILLYKFLYYIFYIILCIFFFILNFNRFTLWLRKEFRQNLIAWQLKNSILITLIFKLIFFLNLLLVLNASPFTVRVVFTVKFCCAIKMFHCLIWSGNFYNFSLFKKWENGNLLCIVYSVS